MSRGQCVQTCVSQRAEILCRAAARLSWCRLSTRDIAKSFWCVMQL